MGTRLASLAIRPRKGEGDVPPPTQSLSAEA